MSYCNAMTIDNILYYLLQASCFFSLISFTNAISEYSLQLVSWSGYGYCWGEVTCIKLRGFNLRVASDQGDTVNDYACEALAVDAW